MKPSRWLALVMVAGTIGLAATPAAADRPGPLARVACARIAPGVCEESGNISLPPHSDGSQSTDTVPKQSTEEDTFLTPLNGRCSVGLVSIPVQVVRPASRYRITLTQAATRARSRGPLGISCRARSRRIQIRVRSHRATA